MPSTYWSSWSDISSKSWQFGASPSTRRSFCQSQCLSTSLRTILHCRKCFTQLLSPGSTPGQSAWVLLGTIRHLDRFFFLSISFLQCYYHSTNITYLHIKTTLIRRGEPSLETLKQSIASSNTGEHWTENNFPCVLFVTFLTIYIKYYLFLKVHRTRWWTNELIWKNVVCTF
jgi:hypothetical protein